MPKNNRGFDGALLPVTISREVLHQISAMAKIQGIPLDALVDRELGNAVARWVKNDGIDKETLNKALAQVYREEQEQ
jgi:hypothetical protein